MLPYLSFLRSWQLCGTWDVLVGHLGVQLFLDQDVFEVQAEFGVDVGGFGVEEVLIQRSTLHYTFPCFHGYPKLKVTVQQI